MPDSQTEPTPMAMRLAEAVNEDRRFANAIKVILLGSISKISDEMANEIMSRAIARALDDAGVRGLVEKLAEINLIVDEQANDESIWFDAVYITEAMLQEKLRRLHEVIEGVSQVDAARAALQNMESDKMNDSSDVSRGTQKKRERR